MSLEFRLDGQLVIINEFNSLVKLTIDSPFQDPSYVMKERWNFECKGFGVNFKIIALVIDKKFRLFIHNNEDNNNYIIDHEDLIDLLQKHELDYIVKETKLKILPMKFFKVL